MSEPVVSVTLTCECGSAFAAYAAESMLPSIEATWRRSHGCADSAFRSSDTSDQAGCALALVALMFGLADTALFAVLAAGGFR